MRHVLVIYGGSNLTMGRVALVAMKIIMLKLVPDRLNHFLVIDNLISSMRRKEKLMGRIICWDSRNFVITCV